MSEDTKIKKKRPAYRDRIVGAGGGGKSAESASPYGKQSAPVEDPNTLQSRATARFIDLIGEGPIVGLATNDGRSVFFNDTPVLNPNLTKNFTGVAIDQRNGAGWGFQSYMPGYPSASNVIPVGSSGQEIQYVDGTADNGGVTAQISNADANAAIVRLSTPAMYRQDRDDGDVHGDGCNFEIYLKNDGGNFFHVLSSAIAGKTMSPYHRDIRVELPAGGAPWTIKVIRTSPESEDTAVRNTIYFISVTEVVDSKLVYPNTALVGVTVDTAQFTGSPPSRSYDIKGLIIRVPSNYNPETRAYTGDWDGTFQWAWTDNPAWCFYDLLTHNRYGAGIPESAISLWRWELYEIAKYCDQLIPDGQGGYKPRFTCNLILNSQQEAYAVINTMASIFRGMAYWAAGAIRVVADMPKNPIALVTNANVIDGTFNYEGTALKARHTICKVIWNDPDDAYRAHVEFVENFDALNKYGPRQTDIVAYGATNRAQAIRAGKWLLDTENTATEVVHFRGGLDMAGIFPGMVVEIADEHYADSVFGGRIITCNIDSTSVTLDRDYTFDAGHTYTLDIMLPSGNIASKTLTNSPGTTNTITWVGPLTEKPLDGAVWVIRSTALSPRQFLILSNNEVTDAQFELFGVFHDPAKFDRVDLDLITPPPHYSLVPTGEIAPPTNLAALLRLYTVGSAIRAAAVVSWSKADDSRVYGYEIQVRGPTDDSFIPLPGSTTMTSIEYKDVIEGFYEFRIRSMALTGKRSTWSEVLSVELTSDIPPSDVVGMEETFDPNGVAFRWTPNQDLNLDHYEVRRGTSWDAGILVASQSNTTYVEKGVPAGEHKYWVKAVSAPSNKYSTNAASITITVAAPPPPVVTVAINETDYAVRWNEVVSNFKVDYYEVRFGETWETASVLGTTKATVWESPVKWGGSRRFWVAGVDIAGNYGTPGYADLIIEPPSVVSNLTAQVIDNNVLLRWSPSVTGRLPVDHYVIRRGDVFASAIEIGTKSGTFTTVIESVAGLFTYWVSGVDTAGNEGPETAVTARVEQPPDYILHDDTASDFGVLKQAGTLTRTSTGDSYAGFHTPYVSPGTHTFTFAVWLKAGTETGNVTLHLRNGSDVEYGIATVTPTGTWQRFSVTATFTAGSANNIRAYVNPVNNTGTVGATLHVYDPELSEGSNIDLLVTQNFSDPTYGLLSRLSWAPNVLDGPFNAVLTNAFVDGGTLFGPVNLTETYGDHFTSHSWSTPQDQITAGYPVYIQPVPTTAQFVEIIDYGATIPTTIIAVNMTKADTGGVVGATCTIETSTNGSTWTTVGTDFQAIASNFRYIRVTIDFTSDGIAVTNVTSLHYVLSVKQKTDNGTISALSTDVGGTVVNFNTPFVDVLSIVLTPMSTLQLTAVADFVDAPNPTSFKVLVFNSAGARVSSMVSWTVRGV